MVNQILVELRRQMNGAVSQTMRELGQRDFVNFGVSLPTIKEIALRYAPNHQLACELSARKSREARIAALYVAQAELLTAQQMELWSEDWQNEEIARLSAMILFHKSADAVNIAGQWMNSTQFRRVAALYIIGKVAALADESLVEQVLLTPTVDAALVYALREIYAVRVEFRDRISECAENIEELRWQIEAL